MSLTQGNKAVLRSRRQIYRFEQGSMARRNFPDLTVEVVQHGHGGAIWLVAILGGVLGVFALTALIVSLLG
jgi:hypothetical protein